MAKKTKVMPKETLEVVPNPKTGTTKQLPMQSLKPVADNNKVLITSVINKVFQNEDNLREAISANLKERSIASKAISERVQTAFANFSPSKLSSTERSLPNYLNPDDKLSDALDAVITKGIEATRKSKVKRSIRLQDTPELRKFIVEKGRSRSSIFGTIKLDDLIKYINSKPGTIESLTHDPTFTHCEAEMEAEKRLEEIMGSSGDSVVTKPSMSSDGEDWVTTESFMEGSSAEESASVDIVKDNVILQMKTVSSPETSLQYSVTNRSSQNDIQGGVQTFELRSGPTDVTSYHDFNSLQIAFEDVWTEIFDGELASLGKALYHEYVKLKTYVGTNDDTPIISTVRDLQQLMAEIREFSNVTQVIIPPELLEDSGSNPSDKDGVNINVNVGGDIQAIVDAAGWLIDKIKNIFAGKPQIRWGDFPGPLPSKDVISVEFEDNAVSPGVVEIVIMNTEDTWWWKGIEFREFDGMTGNVVCGFRISTDPNDGGVWNSQGFNRLPLWTHQVKNGVLEFQKQNTVAGDHTGFYILAGLDERIKDRTRVTFTWVKD
ncbi:MAG TPA: hypothetical protein DCX54_03490 [Flavobacteriales bacterium]|nr:hypothetical protein [Flavobacteriales bacterium]